MISRKSASRPLTLLVATLVFLGGSLAFAGGISGRVMSSSGAGKSGVTITADVGGQKISVKTNSQGYFTITVPPSSYGASAKVYAGGTYTTKCTIPTNGAYATVNVTFK